MTDRKALRRKLIRLQNVHGRRRGREIFEEEEKQKLKTSGEIDAETPSSSV